MNRTKIEWTDYTWNPITGCLHGCEYCYARKIAARFKKVFPNGFEPTFHQERLRDPFDVKKPSKIFTVSMGDMFGEWVHGKWITQVFDVMGACNWHTFLVLTKNPKGIRKLYGEET
jgi:protein gp37